MDERRTKLAHLPLQGWWERTESSIKVAINNGKCTEQIHGDSFKPRKKIHRDILDELIESALQHPIDNKSVMIGGLPASGKTRYLAKHCQDYAIVSPDLFKEILIERDLVPDIETVTPMETGSLCHLESAFLAKQFFFELLELGVNVALDFNMNFVDSVEERVKVLKDKGYFTEIILLNIKKQESIRRTVDRHLGGVIDFLGGEGLGGRYVPIGYIKKCSSDECFSITKHHFDKSYLYNVNGAKPILEGAW